MSERKIKPCKICGAKAVVYYIRRINEDYCCAYKVECSEGCASTGMVAKKELAIKLWNNSNCDG